MNKLMSTLALALVVTSAACSRSEQQAGRFDAQYRPVTGRTAAGYTPLDTISAAERAKANSLDRRAGCAPRRARQLTTRRHALRITAPPARAASSAAHGDDRQRSSGGPSLSTRSVTPRSAPRPARSSAPRRARTRSRAASSARPSAAFSVASSATTSTKRRSRRHSRWRRDARHSSIVDRDSRLRPGVFVVNEPWTVPQECRLVAALSYRSTTCSPILRFARFDHPT